MDVNTSRRSDYYFDPSLKGFSWGGYHAALPAVAKAPLSTQRRKVLGCEPVSQMGDIQFQVRALYS